MLTTDRGAQQRLSSLLEDGAGEDSGNDSDNSLPAIRYASDESDTDAEAKSAPKHKKKGAASSDEEDDGDALLAACRSKGRKRGAGKKAEEVLSAST